MTALNATASAGLGSGRVSAIGVLHSEWIKLRSLRSTWFSLLAAVLIVDGLGTVFSAVRAHRMQSPGPKPPIFAFDATEVSLRGVFLAQLAIGVLGVLVVTAEYSSGMIRSSMTAVPHRHPVLLAKATVFTVTAFIVSLVATLLGFLFGQQALASTHAQATLSTPGAERAIVGSALYLTLIGLLAVGLGFLIRSTAGAIATLFGIVLVAPLVANSLPSPYSTDIIKYLPLSAGQRVISTSDVDPTLLGPWAGLGITALYCLAALVAGAIALKYRDA